MRLSVGLAVAAVLLCGCDRWSTKAEKVNAAVAAKERRQGMLDTCASKLTYARLKEYVFDQAAQVRNSDPRRLDPLAAQSVVRMEDPVVKSRDDDLNITVCTGRFVLNLPPGVQDAFGGKPVVGAKVEYAAQAAADGSGLVYSMSGAEPIIYRLATLGLANRPGTYVTVAPAEVASEPDMPLAKAEPEAKLPERPIPPTQTATVEAKPRPEVRQPAAPKAVASPSFNCRHARSRSEKLVCGSGSLAAADRQMSAIYYGQMARADAATKRALRRTRDSFLAKRDRCSTDSCVAQVYQERVAEIRRIASNPR